jgi:cell division protein ZapA (FtsZ GTPase activity inhibitor)|tara:strand:+ start:480 stop:776 length:297 start_codon:yes stop_codon:yes gene_type:complete
MSKLLKIKITLANRVYPLTISEDQEENIRKSSKKIEVMIKQLEQSYAVRDKQDVLAMCALQYASQLEQHNNDASKNKMFNNDKINHLVEMIDEHMNSF